MLTFFYIAGPLVVAPRRAQDLARTAQAMVAPKYGPTESSQSSLSDAQDDPTQSTDKKREKVVGRLISMAEGIRAEGNAMFKNMEYAQAADKYSQAIHMLQKVGDFLRL